MTMLVYIFGAFLILAGISLIVSPNSIFGFLRGNEKNLGIYVGAVAARVLFGGALVYAADVSRFPLVMSILGWIAILAAALLLIIGRRNFERIISWVIQVFRPYGRIAGLFSAVFGAFLLYAFI